MKKNCQVCICIKSNRIFTLLNLCFALFGAGSTPSLIHGHRRDDAAWIRRVGKNGKKSNDIKNVYLYLLLFHYIDQNVYVSILLKTW